MVSGRRFPVLNREPWGSAARWEPAVDLMMGAENPERLTSMSKVVGLKFFEMT
jgi:hypothetical protein